MKDNNVGKLLYGALFVIALPALLVLWAKASAANVLIPVAADHGLGLTLVSVGAVLMAGGMSSLWRRGGGLPMNAFPPPNYVAGGVYAIFPHPIYLGFVLACAGLSIAAGSASGLWLITPIVALASAALLMGYEIPDLQRRFGTGVATRGLVPPDDDAKPTVIAGVRCLVAVLLPWLAIYELVVSLGLPAGARNSYLPLERSLPVVEWTEVFYATCYVVVCLAPFLISTNRALRRFCTRGWISMALVFPAYLVLPLIAVPRPFISEGPLGDLLKFERMIDSPAAAFPSYHVIWALIAADALGKGKRSRLMWLLWALAVAISCVTTGMHSVLDVVAGVATYVVVANADKLWQWILNRAEALANSWQEWRLGPVRVINHGAYAGAAALVSLWMIDSQLGLGRDAVTLSVFVGGTVGAAMWAQWIEGSPSLLRPLGFYGGMIGTTLAAVVGAVKGINPWVVLCAICVSAPWLQAIGRLRCMVQGCCHGGPVHGVPGIRYMHPRSRVCRIAHMDGVAVHPTQVYSILCNAYIAVVLLRLLSLQARTSLICGVYMMLSGIGRFVEESLRGEPQTPVYWGLRLYQWVSIGTLVIGAWSTTVTSAPLVQSPVFHLSSVGLAAVCGLLAWFVSGVDFPESNARFARLT